MASRKRDKRDLESFIFISNDGGLYIALEKWEFASGFSLAQHIT